MIRPPHGILFYWPVVLIRFKENDVYAWGWNESGQLGLPSRNVADHRRECLSCTRGDESRSARSGPGGDDYSENGGGPVEFVSVAPEPRLLESIPSDLIVCDVRCGDRHSVLLDGISIFLVMAL